MFPPVQILTPRMRLVPFSPEIVRAFFDNRDKLPILLGACVPHDWPVDPVILQILHDKLDDASAFVWSDYIYIHRRDNTVIGDGGFKGPPDANGCVDIGYAVIPGYRGQGLATEGARALLEQAFSHAEVCSVRADTSVNGLASMGVLRRIDMRQYGIGHNDEDGDLYCWQVTREQYEQNMLGYVAD